MNEISVRPSGIIITLPDTAARPARPRPSADEKRGEILFFTGVRYERPAPSPGPSHPFISDGPGRRRRF